MQVGTGEVCPRLPSPVDFNLSVLRIKIGDSKHQHETRHCHD